MSIETEIRARLVADGTVGGLVGARIDPLILEQNPTYPAITYQRISGRSLRTLAAAADRIESRIQVSSWAETYLGALALADAVRASLDGFNGTLTTLDAQIFLELQLDDFEEVPRVYRVIQDYAVLHTT